MASQPVVPAEVFRFIRQLRRNNNRDWFAAHKTTYLNDVRDPLLEFVEAFGPKLRTVSRHFVADPRPTGGSMFRIYRDTRFSRDKRPYKTHIGLHFRHERAKDAYAPGFYLHLEPGASFVGVGIWHPGSPTLAKIRDAIADDSARWKRARDAKRFRERFDLAGDRLVRPPRGYDPAHPMIEDLKRKDFIGVHPVADGDVVADGFLTAFADHCRAARPFVRFLTTAVALPF